MLILLKLTAKGIDDVPRILFSSFATIRELIALEVTPINIGVIINMVITLHLGRRQMDLGAIHVFATGRTIILGLIIIPEAKESS